MRFRVRRVKFRSLAKFSLSALGLRPRPALCPGIHDTFRSWETVFPFPLAPRWQHLVQRSLALTQDFCRTTGSFGSSPLGLTLLTHRRGCIPFFVVDVADSYERSLDLDPVRWPSCTRRSRHRSLECSRRRGPVIAHRCVIRFIRKASLYSDTAASGFWAAYRANPAFL